jgi:hypothetical protein
MRYPEAERKPFTSPAWTAEMFKQYTGPVFRAVVSWVPSGAARGTTSDLEAPSRAALREELATTCKGVTRDRGTLTSISYGPHTAPWPWNPAPPGGANPGRRPGLLAGVGRRLTCNPYLRRGDETMNAKTQAAVIQHGRQLIALFGLTEDTEPLALCRKLRRLESQAGTIALRLCNGPEYPNGEDQVDRMCETILDKVDALLGFRSKNIPVFINRDPRGYALKINDEWMRAAHTVSRDGKPVYTGTDPEAWLLRHQGQSVHYATKHGGYAIDHVRLHSDWGGYGIIAPDLTD